LRRPVSTYMSTDVFAQNVNGFLIGMAWHGMAWHGGQKHAVMSNSSDNAPSKSYISTREPSPHLRRQAPICGACRAPARVSCTLDPARTQSAHESNVSASCQGHVAADTARISWCERTCVTLPRRHPAALQDHTQAVGHRIAKGKTNFGHLRRHARSSIGSLPASMRSGPHRQVQMLPLL